MQRSHTDARLKQLHSDVVYTCQVDNKSAYVYILIEQQTTPDPLLPFRSLQYNLALLAGTSLTKQEEQTENTAPHHPAPVSLYSGKKTPYIPNSVDIYDCFEDPILARAEVFKLLPPD